MAVKSVVQVSRLDSFSIPVWYSTTKLVVVGDHHRVVRCNVTTSQETSSCLWVMKEDVCLVCTRENRTEKKKQKQKKTMEVKIMRALHVPKWTDTGTRHILHAARKKNNNKSRFRSLASTLIIFLLFNSFVILSFSTLLLLVTLLYAL